MKKGEKRDRRLLRSGFTLVELLLVVTILGILAAVFIVVVRFLLDNTYKTELDIQNDLGLPVLGVIPSVETSGKSNIPYAERTVR